MIVSRLTTIVVVEREVSHSCYISVPDSMSIGPKIRGPVLISLGVTFRCGLVRLGNAISEEAWRDLCLFRDVDCNVSISCMPQKTDDTASALSPMMTRSLANLCLETQAFRLKDNSEMLAWST